MPNNGFPLCDFDLIWIFDVKEKYLIFETEFTRALNYEETNKVRAKFWQP